MQKFFKQKNGGFTLVETFVAISIFTVSLLGIISVLASNIANISYAKQKMTATYLAQEGIEYVRNIRDTDALTYGGSAGWSSHFFGATNASISPPAPTDTLYAREISKTQINPNEVIITSVVCWPKPAGFTNCDTAKNEVSFSENLFNWIE